MFSKFNYSISKYWFGWLCPNSQSIYVGKRKNVIKLLENICYHWSVNALFSIEYECRQATLKFCGNLKSPKTSTNSFHKNHTITKEHTFLVTNKNRQFQPSLQTLFYLYGNSHLTWPKTNYTQWLQRSLTFVAIWDYNKI